MWLKSLAVFVLLLAAERDDVRIASAHPDVHPELWCSVASVHQLTYSLY